MPESCEACGAENSREVADTTRLLLTNLDDRRRGILAEQYGGQVPKVLCAACMLAATATVNGVHQ